MQNLWDISLPGSNALEHGGTFVENADGTHTIINQSGGTSGTFSPDLTAGAGQTVEGTFHTHPYSAAEGGYTDIAFSDGDFVYFSNNPDADFHIIQSGDTQFAAVRTDETVTTKTNQEIRDIWNNKYNEELNKGSSFETACEEAAKETADELKFKLYRGEDGNLQPIN